VATSEDRSLVDDILRDLYCCSKRILAFGALVDARSVRYRVAQYDLQALSGSTSFHHPIASHSR
jgi:hypothetical protein